MPGEIQVRAAVEDDIAAVQAIYAHEVLHGMVSFELEPPDVDEMRRRYRTSREAGYPYLLATLGDRVAGFAYAGPYRSRPAYRFTVENSVYVAPWARRRGVAARLLDALISECEALPFRQMVAIIGDSANAASIELHRKAGFLPVGTLRDVGYKFDRWLDTVIMQRQLGPGAAEGLPSERR
jgi:phosphinothricin acetyltransferase